jgi:hypothetical protein
MPHHCPFPVRSADSRRCYHTGSAPGFTLGLALVAALSGYAGLNHADSYLIPKDHEPTVSLATPISMPQPFMGWKVPYAGDACCGLVDDRKTSSGERPLSIGLSKSRAWLTHRW